MIRQSDLQLVHRDGRRLAELERLPDVAAYLQLQGRHRKSLDALRERVRAGESVAEGRLRLAVKHVATVAWERLLAFLREVPAVRDAIAADTRAALAVALAGCRDNTSDFVGQRVTVEVVEA